MKVLQVIPSLAAAHGGPSHAARMFEKALASAGAQVVTACTDDDGPGPRLIRKSGVPIAEEGTRIYFPRRTRFYKVAPSFASWALAHARDYDVVHVHALFSFTSTVAAWAARLRGVPYVVRPLGTLDRYSRGRRRMMKNLSLAFVEGPILRHAAAVHFTSESERLQAQETGLAMRPTVIPLGIDRAPVGDAARFARNHPDLAGRPLVLSLSRLAPKKNIEGLLRAWALASAEHPSAVLAVAGSGEPGYLAALQALSASLGLAERVAWLGFVTGEAKADAFAAAAIFALPSFSENFGIAAAEALFHGLPCVLGEGVALAPEVASAGAGIVTGPTPEAIAGALDHLLSDDTLRASMRGRAVGLAESRYSLDVMGNSLMRLYASVAGQHQRELA